MPGGGRGGRLEEAELDSEAGSLGSRPLAVTEELGAPARWLGFLHLSFYMCKMRGWAWRPRGLTPALLACHLCHEAGQDNRKVSLP